MRELQAALVLAQRRHRSRQALLDKGFIAREGVDEVSTDMHITQARLDAAQQRLEELLAGTRREQVQAQEALLKQIDARLHALDVELQHSQLKAPFAGTIVERLAAVGTVVSPAQPVLRLLEDTNLEARVGVPPDAAATLTLGSVQSLQVGRTVLKAQVSALVPELDSATRTVMVVLHLPRRQDNMVLAGQVARLQLTETVESAGFWLPITALSKGPHGLWSCFALVPAGGTEPSLFRTEYRSLEVLYTANERVFVRGLLQEGDRIVSSGVHRLVAAQLVRPAA
jgi:RND family efflux transporter MFP subunit